MSSQHAWSCPGEPKVAVIIHVSDTA